MGRRVPAVAARRARRSRGPQAPGSSCSTTSTRTARPAGARSSRHARASDLIEGRDPRGDDRRAAPPLDLDVVIGRASDYFGPGTTQSALGESVFGRAIAGKRAQVMGKPDHAAQLLVHARRRRGRSSRSASPPPRAARSGTCRSPRRARPAPGRRPRLPARRPAASPHRRRRTTALRLFSGSRVPPHPLPVHRTVDRRRRRSSATRSVICPRRSTTRSRPPSSRYRARNLEGASR